jgi:hypothetical protein
MSAMETLSFAGRPRAGVWVDRVRRRPVLIAADVGRVVALATGAGAVGAPGPHQGPALRRRPGAAGGLSSFVWILPSPVPGCAASDQVDEATVVLAQPGLAPPA